MTKETQLGLVETGMQTLPAVARREDPTTAKLAAAQLNAAGRANRLCLIVLNILGSGSQLTVPEIAELAGEYVNTISPRMAPLRRAGLVETGPKRACTVRQTHSLMLTWRITESGRKAIGRQEA